MLTADSPIEALNLSTRGYNALLNGRVRVPGDHWAPKREERPCRTVGDVMRLSKRELLRYQNFGRKSYKELIAALEREGFMVSDRCRHCGQRMPSTARAAA